MSRGSSGGTAYQEGRVDRAELVFDQIRSLLRSQELLWGVLPLTLALAVGLYIRLSFVGSADFPLNDGGLFYAMAGDLQNAGYALPAFTSYNVNDIPFVYPPFGLYVAALVEDLTPLDMLEVFRFLPFLFNVLTIGAVFLLARSMLGRGMPAAVAAFVFALLPRSFAWLISGGGITRSLAFLLAMLAAYGMHRFLVTGKRKHLALGTVMGGLSALSHPDVGVFTAFTFVLLVLFCERYRRGLAGLSIAFAGMAFIMAPWLLTVLVRHGTGELISAMGTGEHEQVYFALLRLLHFQFTEEYYPPVLAFLGVMGMFVAIARMHFMLPIWLIGTVLIVPRSGATYVSAPLALLIGLLVADVVLPGLFRSLQRISRPAASWPRWRSWLWRFQSPAAWVPGVAGALFLVWLSAYGIANGLHSNAHVLMTVSPYDRDAMRWIAENTPAGSTFLVISGTPSWPVDRVSEWFPAIAQRRSIGTVQGSEWLGKDTFFQRVANHQRLAFCASQQELCIRDWEHKAAGEFDYIYLSMLCCSAELIRTIMESPDYQPVHLNEAIGIWQTAHSAAARSDEATPASG